MYYETFSNDKWNSFDGTSKTTDWGETRYYNEAEWGTGGNRFTGLQIPIIGTNVEMGFTINDLSTTAYIVGTPYTMTWFQPRYATTYSASSLRRYNGGNMDFDRVRPYCVSARETDDIAFFGVT